ncbi:MAG TPA: FG-GAP repeat protein [Polyangia bacterium]|nr:FG-GAP repeat protein [Polyangia bacterium]
MRAATRCLLASFTAVALAAGCDWRDFDTLQGQTPVLRLDPPSGYQTAGDFGGALLPVAPPSDGSAAAWFLASGTASLGLGLMKIDAAGHGSGQTLSGGDLNNLGTDPLTAMAEIPGTSTALLGAPTFRGIFVADLLQATVSQFTTSSSASGETLFGVGVAAGNLTGGATPDLVVSSISNIHVFSGGSHSDGSPGSADLTACPLSLPPAFQARRAMVIGTFLGSGPVVAVGVPNAGAAGSVAFFAATATTTPPTVTCLGLLSAPAAAGVNSGFGSSLAVGDFDGDGAQDLLVGAPPYAVYLYKGPFGLASPPAATVPPPAGAGNFGNALAAANIDGKKGDEALIADSGATVDGKTGAGDVSIVAFSSTPPGPTVIRTLTDHAAGAGESYGAAVAALPFCAAPPCATATPLPLVGSPNNAFVYYTVGAADPRTK